MKVVRFKLLSKDPEAVNWLAISVYALALRYPKKTATEPRTPSTSLDEALPLFLRYGHELGVLEDDLTESINELMMAYNHYYGNRLELKKFTVVYHVDNFYVRVHKLIENTYRLLALMVGLDHERKPAPGEPPFRKQVKEQIAQHRLRGILETVASFEKDKWIRRAREARNLFVHRFRPERWRMLGPQARFCEPDDSEDPMAKTIREIDQSTDLDRFASRKIDELSQTLGVIRVFRDRAHRVLSERVGESGQPPKGRRPK